MANNGNFIHDYEKMVDFKILSKEEFMRSYSYLSDDEYENTKRIYNERCTDEYCPNCDDEVVIFAEMRVQVCPNCGERLYPCSICTERFCRTCPLDD